MEFLGYLPDDELRSFYDGAKVALYTPIDEPLGLVPIEAMAHGVPVVGSNHGGVAETVLHGVTGYLADPRVPEEIAEQLGKLLRDEEKARAFGEAGRRRIEREYAVDRFVNRFLEEIEARFPRRGEGARLGASLGDGTQLSGGAGSGVTWGHALWLPEECGAEAAPAAEAASAADAQRWADAWSHLKGDWIVDVLSPDPFRRPEFIRTLQLLDTRQKVAITTDAESQVVEFVQSVPTHRCECFTLRYDPGGPVNLHRLLGKALLLQNSGFPVVVNVVADLRVLWVVEDITRHLSEHGVMTHVDPWDFDAEGPPEGVGADEAELMRRVASPDRQAAFEERTAACTCAAGSRHLSHVIEHYAPGDAETILSLCHETLVPGGRIVIVTPNPVNLFVITENFWKDPSHVRPYPVDALKPLLTKCGFAVVQAGWDTDTVSEIPEEAKTPAWHEVGRILGHFFYCEDAYAVGEKPADKSSNGTA